LIIGSAAFIRMRQPPISAVGLLSGVFFALWQGKIDNLKSLLFSVAHCVGRPTIIIGKIADAHAAVIH